MLTNPWNLTEEECHQTHDGARLLKTKTLPATQSWSTTMCILDPLFMTPCGVFSNESNENRQSDLSSPASITDDILPWESSDPQIAQDATFVDFHYDDLCFGLNNDDNLIDIHCKSPNLKQQRMSSAERRQRNNISAKKSRKAKKIKDRYHSVTAKSLEKENNHLKLEIQMIQSQIETLRQIIFHRISNSPSQEPKS